MGSPLCVFKHTKPQRNFGSDRKGLRRGRLTCANRACHRLQHSCRCSSHTRRPHCRVAGTTPPVISALAPPLELSVGLQAFPNRVVIFRIAEAITGYFLFPATRPFAGSGRHQASCLRWNHARDTQVSYVVATCFACAHKAGQVFLEKRVHTHANSLTREHYAPRSQGPSCHSSAYLLPRGANKTCSSSTMLAHLCLHCCQKFGMRTPTYLGIIHFRLIVVT